MKNIVGKLIESGWDPQISDYFYYYAQQTNLLSKMDFKLVHERGWAHELEFIRFNTKFNPESLHDYDIELRHLVSNVVSRLEAYILEYCLDNITIYENLSESEEEEYVRNLNNFSSFMNIQYYPSAGWLYNPTNLGLIKETRFEEPAFLKDKYQLFSGFLFIKKDCEFVGTLEVNIGESLDGKPNLWCRCIDNLIQLGIAVKIVDMSGIGGIVGRYAN